MCINALFLPMGKKRHLTIFYRTEVLSFPTVDNPVACNNGFYNVNFIKLAQATPFTVEQ